MGFQSIMRKSFKYHNDVNSFLKAVEKGDSTPVKKRVKRRIWGKISGRIMGRL
jgi:hypothetical protein